MSEPIRVLIVDDHPVVRSGLRNMLSNLDDIAVAGEAASGAEALAQNRALRPDVLVLDVRMPDVSGLQLIPQLQADSPELRLLILTSYENDEYLFGAISAGAHGFLLKSAAFEELAQAIRDVFSGRRQLSPRLVGRVLDELQLYAQEISRYKAGLSDNHVQILRLVAEGLTNREIAGRLHWSEITVKRKVSEILEKLGVATRAQAVSEAVRRGVIQP
jgi:two-component system, NarL family, response regulator DevR